MIALKPCRRHLQAGTLVVSFKSHSSFLSDWQLYSDMYIIGTMDTMAMCQLLYLLSWELSPLVQVCYMGSQIQCNKEKGGPW